MWWINMCVIIRKRHFLCFLCKWINMFFFFSYKLLLLPNEYKPTQNAFQNCSRPGPQNYKSQYITEYQSLLYIFMCLKYWICQRESSGILRSWLYLVMSCLDVKYKFSFNLYISKKVWILGARLFAWDIQGRLQLCSSILTEEFN